MTAVIEFEVSEEGEASILVELPENALGGLQPASHPGVTGRASKTLDHALQGIAPAARSMLEQLKAIGGDVKEIQLEFGIKLNAELNAVIANSSAEGHCQVSVKWVRP